MNQRTDSGNNKYKNDWELIDKIRNSDIHFADIYPIEKFIMYRSFFRWMRKHLGKHSTRNNKTDRNSKRADPSGNRFVFIFAAKESVDKKTYQRRCYDIWNEFGQKFLVLSS